MIQAVGRISVDEALEHAAWVRALSRRLVGDSHLAEDVAQATFLSVLQHPPQAPVRIRAWLGALVRNFARAERRAGLRRTERERAVARSEALAASDELVARAELERRVAQAVLDLDEPYRTVLLLRFFERLPPRAIAARLDLPVETVSTRIERGLGKLRARLDRDFGDRSTWLSALAPFALPHPFAPSLALGIVMNAKLKLALAVLAIAGIFGVWYALRSEPERGSPLAAEQPAGPALVDSGTPAQPAAYSPPAGEDLRRDVASDGAAQATPAAIASAGAKAPELVGRVLDIDGRPAIGVEVELAGPDTAAPKRAHTTTDGSFRISDARGAGRVRCVAEHFVTVLSGVWNEGRERELVIVIAPRLSIAGTVTDELGAPMSKVELRWQTPEDLRARFDEVLDTSELGTWSTTSDADGRFDLGQVPLVEGTRLTAEFEGFTPHSEPAPAQSSSAQLITLLSPEVGPRTIVGRVVDASGAPVAEAYVALGIDTTRTNDEGGFLFDLDSPRSMNRQMGVAPDELTAAKEGFLPAHRVATMVGELPEFPRPVVLVLSEHALGITGRVLDGAGAPVEAAWVWIADATLFGAVDDRPVQLENLLAGDARSTWRSVRTDDEGRFEIAGLLDRDYTLEALVEDTLLRVSKGPVRAGTLGVDLHLPGDGLYPRVAGRVLSSAGRPLAQVHVKPMCDAFRARLRGEVISTSHMALEGVLTDSEGRFELVNVPKSLVYLRLDGEEILPLEYGRYHEDDARFANAEVKRLPVERIEALDITVAVRCHVKIELGDAELADAFALLDETGAELELSVMEGSGRSEGPRAPILSGQSPVVAAPDTSRTLVLYKGLFEILRQPIALEPGTPKTVKL